MTDDQNPYASPKTIDPLPAPRSSEEIEVQAIRRQYLRHETAIKSIGQFYYLIGGLTALAAAIFLGTVFFTELSRPQLTERILLAVLLVAIYGAFAAVFFTIGYGLYRLRGWVKWPVGILSGIGLLSVPIGTLINAYILYVVFGKKGKMVFSPEYQEIVRQTPHIQYRTPLIAWIVLVLFLVALAVGVPLLFLG